MRMSDRVRALFAEGAQTGVLSTSSTEGEVNGAIFGSARLTDTGELLLALGENRSLRFLRQNPRAVFTIGRPGPHPLAWEGVRLYLEVARLESEGELIETMREGVGKTAGEEAARRIRAAVVFRIRSIRPLIDLFP